jgi:hypothetical protein
MCARYKINQSYIHPFIHDVHRAVYLDGTMCLCIQLLHLHFAVTVPRYHTCTLLCYFNCNLISPGTHFHHPAMLFHSHFFKDDAPSNHYSFFFHIYPGGARDSMGSLDDLMWMHNRRPYMRSIIYIGAIYSLRSEP